MIERLVDPLRAVASAMLILGFALSAAAQEGSPSFWGTGTNFHFIGGEEFQDLSPSGSYWSMYSEGFWYFAGTSYTGSVAAPLRLPTGALITGMTVLYRDSDGDSAMDVHVGLDQLWITATGSVGTNEISPNWSSTGSPGVAAEWIDIVPDHTVAYIDGTTAQNYWVLVTMRSSSMALLALRGVIIGWNRQISPAPAEATFTDVPVGSFGFQHVEALAASGITAGCGGGNFCPNQPLTRVQMAVFLSKALGLHWAP